VESVGIKHGLAASAIGLGLIASVGVFSPARADAYSYPIISQCTIGAIGWDWARDNDNVELEETYWNVYAQYCGWWGAG
jgi:hypothetical protein